MSTEPEVVVRKRILVTDDDACILRLVSTILRRAGYDVDTAVNGHQALEKINGTDYNVVVLDLMMPGLSGFEVLARLQTREGVPRYVVVMSAASQDIVTNAINRNVFAALRKPFEIDELIAAVGGCIAEADASAA